MTMLRMFLIVLAISTASLSAQAQIETSVSEAEIERVRASLFPSGTVSNDIFSVRAVTQFEQQGTSGKLYIWTLASQSGVSDLLYKVGALVSHPKIPPKEIRNLDLTTLFPVYMETPGQFAQVGASLNILTEQSNSALIHVHLYSTLSGSGAISGATDMVLKVEAPSLSPILIKNFGKTGAYSRMNIQQRSFSNTRFFKITKDSKLIGLLTEVWIEGRIKQSSCYLFTGGKFSEECKLPMIANMKKLPLVRSFESYFLERGLISSGKKAAPSAGKLHK